MGVVGIPVVAGAIGSAVVRSVEPSRSPIPSRDAELLSGEAVADDLLPAKLPLAR